MPAASGVWSTERNYVASTFLVCDETKSCILTLDMRQEPGALTDEQYMDALIAWSEYEPAAAWRGYDGIVTQLLSVPNHCSNCAALDFMDITCSQVAGSQP